MADNESKANGVNSSSQTVTPQSLVKEEYVQAALAADKGAGARLSAWKVVDFTKRGDNYACVVTSIHVEYVMDGRTSKEVYVVKLNPCKTFESSENFNNLIFAKEANFYMHLAPKLNSILKDGNQKELNFPKYFYISLEVDREIIFLEDLRPRGYKMFDRRRGLDEAHVTLVLRELAKLHAASLLLQNKTPDENLREKYPLLGKNMYYMVRNFEAILKAVQDSVEYAKKIMDKVGEYDRITTWMDTILPKLVDIFEEMACGEPNVVCHGDCWNNNFLFRYNKAGQPEDVMFLDLQMVQYGTPANDLNYLFFTSLTGDVRRPNTEAFLASYYDTLKNIMEDAGQEVPLTQAQLMVDYKNKNLLGSICAMVLVPVVLFEAGDSVDLPTSYEDDFVKMLRKTQEKLLETLNTNPLVKPRFLSVFEELIETGVIP